MSHPAGSASSHHQTFPRFGGHVGRPGGPSRAGRGGVPTRGGRGGRGGRGNNGGGRGGGGSGGNSGGGSGGAGSFANFDMLEWHPQHQSCVRYFVDRAQYTGPVQALAAFINIQLPFQKVPNPIISSTQQNSPPPPQAAAVAGRGQGGAGGVARPAAFGPASYLGPQQAAAGTYPFVTLTPYIRRLVATGFDFPNILHGFFGDDWQEGVGPLHEAERRNYLFASKSDTWLSVKSHYDMDEEQMVPFLRPLQEASEAEIVAVEGMWSEWLAFQDWMIGPRAPESEGGEGGNDGDAMVRDGDSD